MKREFFFWLEKLKITPAERQAVSVVMGLLLVFGTLNMTLSSAQPFAGDQYSELEKKFEQRTAQLKMKKQKRMQRYYPPVTQQRTMVVEVDTVPEETTNKRPPKKEAEDKGSEQNKLINVNKADRETLKLLPGIGPAYSKRIILYRQENGGFKSVEELKKIKGIGEKRLEKLKPFVKLKDSK